MGPQSEQAQPRGAIVTLGLHMGWLPQTSPGLRELHVAKQREDPD